MRLYCCDHEMIIGAPVRKVAYAVKHAVLNIVPYTDISKTCFFHHFNIISWSGSIYRPKSLQVCRHFAFSMKTP